jgi:hypothetical protein
MIEKFRILNAHPLVFKNSDPDDKRPAYLARVPAGARVRLVQIEQLRKPLKEDNATFK